jgi:hypothetical protein
MEICTVFYSFARQLFVYTRYSKASNKKNVVTIGAAGL